MVKNSNPLDQTQSSNQNMLDSIDLSQHQINSSIRAVNEVNVVKKDNFLGRQEAPGRKAEPFAEVMFGSIDRQPSRKLDDKDEIRRSASGESNVLLSESAQSHHLHSSRIFQQNSRITGNNTTVNEPDPAFRPAPDFGRLSESRGTEKTPPLHSDDEVTPRRGLDDMMSARKLEILSVAHI